MNTKNIINLKLKEYDKYFDELFLNVDKNIKLDKEQRIAIVTDSKYMMILAGAGSGKTTTITAKVKYLVEKENINPKDILLLSFTNKAVGELKERINIDFGLDIDIKTFHSLGYSIVRKWNSEIKILVNSEKILFEIINKNLTLKYKRMFKELYLKQKFESVCINFIKLLKAKNYTIDDIENLLLDENNHYNDFIYFIFEVYKEYQEFLISNEYVDFDDMIFLALDKLPYLKDSISYKYVIVDEYQDISLVRFKLIQKIIEICDSKLLVVGDDWQSIYSFSGSEVSLFSKFLDFKDSKILKITNTYRNSQELIDIAGKFIMKNKCHLKKRLKSNKRIKYPVEIIYYNDISQEHFNVVSKIRKIISSISNENIAILARYNHDFSKLRKVNFGSNITFMTVHSSKGLGFQNVIILNMSNDIYGFPTKIENSKYSKILLDDNQEIEERRLFYVALTRTKNKVFILVPKSKPSSFILEIEKYKNVKIIK